MTWNIILAVVSFVVISFILVQRKGWKDALIMIGILSVMLAIISGAIGFLF